MYSLVKIQSKNDHDDDSSHAGGFKIVRYFFPSPFKSDSYYTVSICYSAASDWSVHVKWRRMIGHCTAQRVLEDLGWVRFQGQKSLLVDFLKIFCSEQRAVIGQLFSNRDSRSSLLLLGRSGGPR